MSDEILHGAMAIADVLKLPRRKVYSLIRAGRLPHWKEGDNVLSTRGLITEWIEGRKQEARVNCRQLEDA